MHGILKMYGINRVFILGAGFSAPWGMPLTGSLLKYIHNVASTKKWFDEGDDPTPNGEADWLLQELCWYFPTEKIDHDFIQNEELSRRFDIERFLSYVMSVSAFGEGKFTEALKGWIAEAIYTAQMSEIAGRKDLYDKFVNNLESSLVLTFNWDTILETALEEQGIKYAFDLQSTYEKSIVPIIKLHGSIDWFSLPSDLLRRPWMNFDPVSDSFKECVRAKGDLIPYLNSYLIPWIVIPSFDKIFQVISLGEIWQVPWIYLQDDLEVVIVGFSMREDDFHTRAFIYPQLVDGSRSGALKVKVIDRASNQHEQEKIRDRFKGVEGCQFFFDGFSMEAIDFIKQG